MQNYFSSYYFHQSHLSCFVVIPTYLAVNPTFYQVVPLSLWSCHLNQMKKMSNVTMTSSLSKSVSLVWVCGVEKGEREKAWGTGEAIDLWKTGQSVLNMGPEWNEFCTLLWWPPPQVQDSSIQRLHTLILSTGYHCIILLIIFSYAG